MANIETNAGIQDAGDRKRTKKTYAAPHLRVYGTCRELTRTVTAGTGARDTPGTGNVKTV